MHRNFCSTRQPSARRSCAACIPHCHSILQPGPPSMHGALSMCVLTACMQQGAGPVKFDLHARCGMRAALHSGHRQLAEAASLCAVIPSIEMAAAGLDSITAIVGFAVCSGIAIPSGNLVYSILSGPLQARPDAVQSSLSQPCRAGSGVSCQGSTAPVLGGPMPRAHPQGLQLISAGGRRAACHPALHSCLRLCAGWCDLSWPGPFRLRTTGS